MVQRIVLCGFMGSGKTTVGKALAQHLGWAFYDTDQYIEKQQGMSIPEIFSQKGEPFFRELEHLTAKKLSHQCHCVISTGGQVMTLPRNTALFQEDTSLIVLLNPPYAVCYERIKDSDRPLVVNNPPQQLKAIFHQRSALYEAVADFQIDSRKEVQKIVAEICSYIK